jgi:hypothetical protein
VGETLEVSKATKRSEVAVKPYVLYGFYCSVAAQQSGAFALKSNHECTINTCGTGRTD